MSQLRNCPNCGRVFSYLNRNLCPRCLDKEEDMFKEVRTYIRENPGATIIETAEATEVPEDTILRFLREGRLISQGLQSSIVLHCNRCGDVINSGTYCQTCRDELNQEIRNISGAAAKAAPQKPAARSGDRMRILENHKKNGR